MRALIARDLADAGIVGLSADRRFATAYNAALQAANMAIVLRWVSRHEQGRTSPGVVRKHQTCLGKGSSQLRRLFRDLSAKAECHRLHLLQRRHGDRIEGDPCPSLSVLRRSRRLDHEKPPFTENIGVRTRSELCRRRAPVVGYHTTILVGLPDF